MDNLYTHILLYIWKSVCRKIPRSEIAGSKSQCNDHFEGYNAIVFHTTGLFAPHKHHRRVSACLGEEMFEDRWVPVLGAALKTHCDRKVLAASRKHWNEPWRCQVHSGCSGSRKAFCSTIAPGRPLSEKTLDEESDLTFSRWFLSF